MKSIKIENQIETMRRQTSVELDRRTIADIRAAMGRMEIRKESTGILEVIMRLMRNGFVQVGVAAVVVAAIVGMAVMMSGNPEKPVAGTEPCAIPGGQSPEQVKATELAAVQKLFEMKNAKALANALGSGGYETKVAAANYLAMIGDANSIAALEKASSEWRGGAGENPFTKAAEAIKTRIQAVKPDAGKPATDANSTVAAPAAKKERVIADADAQVITVKVVEEETGKPLTGAKVKADDAKGDMTAVTDAQGQTVVRILKKTEYARLVATSPGHVGQQATFRDEAAGHVPGRETFTLARGIAIGGVARNPEGEAIEGATVDVYRYYSGPVPDDDGRHIAYVKDVQKTGKDGRWRCDVVPADMVHIGISLEHSEYQRRSWSNDKPEGELKDQTAVVVMEHGLRIYGAVKDESGQPIKGARVMFGEYSGDVRATTGGDGRFDIRNAENKKQVVTVSAKGYATVLRELPVEAFADEQVFVMDKGRLLAGKVVDANGTPVAGASVSVDKWQGYSAMRKNLKTDAAGTFEWKTAPAGAMDFSVMAKGHKETIVTGIVADGQEKVFVLGETLRMTGKVTDAATGEPIGRFRLVPGIAWADQDGMYLSFQDSIGWVKQCTAGQYDYTFERFGKGYGVKIMADGYLPTQSRFIEPNERVAICDIVLQKSSGIKGTVRLSDGKPAAGVTVCVFRKDVSPGVQNGKLLNEPDGASAKTDANGVFSLTEREGQYKVGAIGIAGLAMTTDDEMKQSGEVKLAAWGRVEGQYFAGSKPAAGRKVSLVYQGEDWSGIHEGQTDKEGRFVFTMVRPGLATIDGHSVDVVSGQTTTAVIGGTGRTVRVELVLPDELPGVISEKSFNLHVTPQVDEEALLKSLPLPANIDSMTMAQVAEWYQNFNNTDEGKRFIKEHVSQATQGRLYMPVKVEGRVAVVEDVPAGWYVLEGQVYQLKADGSADYQKPVARIYHEFEMPRIEEGQLDIPLDLGRIRVGEKPAAGQMAPDFELEDADGRKMRLSDHQGKVVLVVLCPSQGGPEDPEIASLKKVYATYGGEGRFAMIGIVPGRKSHPIVRVMVREMAVPWPLGYTGAQKATKILRDYGAGDVGKWNVLIGTDGKIIASNLKGEELMKKVEEAIAAKQQF